MEALDDHLVVFTAAKSLKDSKSFVCLAMSGQPSWGLRDYEQNEQHWNEEDTLQNDWDSPSEAVVVG